MNTNGVSHQVLQRMSVNGHDSDGSGPLVVLFVETLVEVGAVEQPDGKKKRKKRVRKRKMRRNRTTVLG